MMPRESLRDNSDGGFTLVEVLVTMTLSIMVLLAVLAISDAFGRHVAANNALTTSEDTARGTVDTLVAQLTNATTAQSGGTTIGPILRQSPYDLIFVSAAWNPKVGTTPAGVGTAQPVRYCIDESGTLWTGRQTTFPTDPLAEPPAPTHSVPTTAECTGTLNGKWTYGQATTGVVVAQSSLSGDQRLRTVGIKLALTVADRSYPLVLQTSVTARNAVATPSVVASDFTCTKASAGSLWTVRPVGGSLQDSDGAAITVDYYSSATNGRYLGRGAIQLNSGGAQNLGIKETSVASASAIQPVTVVCPS